MTSAPSRIAAGRTGIADFDFSMVARGASTGLTILLVGGLVAPLVVNLFPALGFVWLPVVSLSAFVTASWRGVTSESPVLQGGCSAVGSYVLVLPLVFHGSGGLDGVQVVATTATAIAVGGGVVLLRRQLRERRSRPASKGR